MTRHHDDGFPRLMQAYSSDDTDNSYPIEKWAYNPLDVMLFKKTYSGMDVREGGLSKEDVMDRMVNTLYHQHPQTLSFSEMQKSVKVRLAKEDAEWCYETLANSPQIQSEYSSANNSIMYSLTAMAFNEMKENREQHLEMIRKFMEDDFNRSPLSFRFSTDMLTKDQVVYGLIILILLVLALKYFYITYAN